MRAPGQIGRNFVLLGVGQIVSTALGFLLMASLTRALGPADFGSYYLVLATVGLVSVVVDWGQGSTVVREVARGRADRASFIASAAMLRILGIGFATVAAYVIARVSGYSNLIVWLTVFGVLASVPGSFAMFFGYVFRGLDRTDIDVTSGLLMKTIATLATVAALALGGGVAAAVLVPAIGGVVGLLFGVRMLRTIDVQIAAPTSATSREIFTAGLPLVAMSLTIAMHGFMEVTLLAILTDREVVGWFGAARTLLGIAILPATILATASFTEMSRAADNKDEFVRILAASVRPLVAVASLASCMFFVFAVPGVRIAFGRAAFDPSALVLQVCAAFLPIFFINFLLGNAAVALQKSVQIAVAKAICVALSGIASWFLVRHFQSSIGNGGVGLMISYGASELLMLATFIALLPQGTLRKVVFSYLLRAYLVAGLAAVVGLAITASFPLWVAVGIVFAVFVMAAMGFGLVRLADIKSVVEAIGSAADQARRLR